MPSVLDQLFPFQREDVEYLASRFHVADFSEMGTGKTYKALALDEIRRSGHRGHTLVVAPLSTHGMWADHFERVAGRTTRIIDPKNRDGFFPGKPVEVYIVHWEALRLMPELQNLRWLHLIVDEVQKACNRKTKQTKALKKLSAMHKTGLTGTPVNNRPDDLWSILHWLYPKDKRFSSYWRFFKKFVDATQHPYHKYWEIHGPKNTKTLQEWIAPFTIRRLKTDVMPDLPDKYYTEIRVELSDKQRRIYNQMREDMLAWVGEHEDQPLVAPVTIAKLVRLQQIALATPTIAPDGSVQLDEPSSKLDALFDIIERAGGQKIVVFSQYTRILDLLKTRLNKAKIDYAEVTGSIPPSDRPKQIAAFQKADGAQIFLGTISAGGVGITLTAASTVVFLDRTFSPSANSQAEDRLHRYGQENAVQVIDLVANDTIDHARGLRLELKKGWIRAILGDKQHATVAS